MTLLHLIKPLTAWVPEVQQPSTQVPFKQRAKWTIMCLFIFLVCCQIPLFGVKVDTSNDPFGWIRTMLASNRGTLMELGISPLVTASMIMQLFTGLGVLRVDQSVREDRELSSRAEKLLALIITFAEAVVYILSGMYGPVSQLGLINSVGILIQLMLAGVMVMMLDELLQKGYGLGSGISLFLATNICESIIWKALSPLTIKTSRGVEFEGALISTFHMILTKPSLPQALWESFTRSNLPNLLNLLATLVVFAVVIWCQNLKIELPIAQRGVRGVQYTHTIKLFYTSNIPIILLSSCVSNISFFSRLLYRTFPSNIFVSILGSWEDIGGHSIPRGGFAYYLSPPTSIAAVLFDPIHTILYMIIMVSACAGLSTLWLEISQMSAKHVYEQFKQAGREIKGFPGTATLKLLNLYIPTAAIFGGIAVACLTIFADFLGAIGSGTSLLLAVNIIHNYHEMLTKEKEFVE
jgi:protein transport protein SEC61 subunit alpha